MQIALAGTALLMGMVGGPHCVAMCGAACAGVIRIVRAPPGAGAVSLPRGPRLSSVALAFHGGRVAGYAAAGALAATAVRGLELAGQHVAALQPLWILLQAFVLAWGLMLAVAGRQPVWTQGVGRRLAARLRALTVTRGGVMATGALWAGMPCGLLYSALLMAGLANGPLQAAMVMALFAAGSGLSLLLAPWLWERLRAGAGAHRREWGTRLAGALLAAMALHAIWTSLSRQIAIWCG